MSSRADGGGVLAVASALAGSGLASSLLSGDSTDDMEPFGTSKMAILFVV